VALARQGACQVGGNRGGVVGVVGASRSGQESCQSPETVQRYLVKRQSLVIPGTWQRRPQRPRIDIMTTINDSSYLHDTLRLDILLTHMVFAFLAGP